MENSLLISTSVRHRKQHKQQDQSREEAVHWKILCSPHHSVLEEAFLGKEVLCYRLPSLHSSCHWPVSVPRATLTAGAAEEQGPAVCQGTERAALDDHRVVSVHISADIDSVQLYPLSFLPPVCNC